MLFPLQYLRHVASAYINYIYSMMYLYFEKFYCIYIHFVVEVAVDTAADGKLEN